MKFFRYLFFNYNFIDHFINDFINQLQINFIYYLIDQLQIFIYFQKNLEIHHIVLIEYYF